MTSNEDLLEINRIQTKYWGIREARKDKFKRNIYELDTKQATIIHCPNHDCYNGYLITYCDCLNSPKCSRCNGKGVISERCPTCEGQAEVLMHSDGRIEVLV